MGFGGGALIASAMSTRLLALYDGGFDPSDSTTVASGDAVMKLFLTLALVYFVVMMGGAFSIRIPPQGWAPRCLSVSSTSRIEVTTSANVSANSAIKTTQFWKVWVAFFSFVTAGMGLLEQASPMIQDFFRDGGVSQVSAAAGAAFVGILSVSNMAGRVIWSGASDYVGRKRMYSGYLGAAIVLYFLLATVGSITGGIFVMLVAMIISLYGGGFATLPAYLRDLFGTGHVGAIHGRLLTAWSAAAIAGPLIVNGFLDAQGIPGQLVASDYRPGLFTMVGILAIGWFANHKIFPVEERFHSTSQTLHLGTAS